jgi:hypothetical protein
VAVSSGVSRRVLHTSGTGSFGETPAMLRATRVGRERSRVPIGERLEVLDHTPTVMLRDRGCVSSAVRRSSGT